VSSNRANTCSWHAIINGHTASAKGGSIARRAPKVVRWQPVITVKTDGTKLFLAWYDRRNDPNNSLIDVYGRWASIATDGSVGSNKWHT